MGILTLYFRIYLRYGKSLQSDKYQAETMARNLFSTFKTQLLASCPMKTEKLYETKFERAR